MDNNLVTNITIDDVNSMYTSTENNKNNTPKNVFDIKNYLNTQLEDGQSSKTITIRILPISASETSPFVEIKTHGLKVDKKIAKRGYKSFICLNSKNINVDRSRRCPICEKATEYYQLSEKETDPSKKKAYLDKAKSMFSKTTYIARVVERGKENEGVKFWRFNGRNDEKDPYHLIQNLYKLRRDESIQAGNQKPYNIYDLIDGKDLILNITRNVNGRGVTISVSDAGFPSPLHKDLGFANSLISDSKVWTDMYGIKDADYLTIIANDYVPVWDKDKKAYVAFDSDIEKTVDLTTGQPVIDGYYNQNENVQPQQNQNVWNAPDFQNYPRKDVVWNNNNNNQPQQNIPPQPQHMNNNNFQNGQPMQQNVVGQNPQIPNNYQQNDDIPF